MTECERKPLLDFSSSFGAAVDAWLAGQKQNTWLHVDPVAIYVRKARHCIDRQMVPTFDIANIEVDPCARGKGFFTAVLDAVRSKNPYEGIFIENVLNPQLCERLRRQGWRPLDDGMSFFEPSGNLRRRVAPRSGR